MPLTDHTLPVPHCTINEAGGYLRLSRDTIERMLVEADDVAGPVEGKLRFQRLPIRKVKLPIRIISADVLAMLPMPQGAEVTA